MSVPVNKILDELTEAKAHLESRLASSTDNLLASETVVMASLAAGANPSMSWLADHAGLSRGRLSHIIDRLEQEDLVERRPDPEDGRSQRVALKAKGRTVAERAASRTREAEAELAESLGEAGLAMLSQQLRSAASC